MKKLLTILGILFLIGSPAWAVPTVDMIGPATPIQAGNVFNIQVIVDGDDIGQELLAFGFDIGALQNVSYLGYALNPAFSDDSLFAGLDVAGSAFPGITDDDLTLATLSFKALTQGIGSISLDGAYDGLFSGLYYEVDGFSFNPTLTFDIQPAPIPEPSTVLLLITGLAGLIGLKRKL